MNLDYVGSVVTLGGNSAEVEGFIPEPGRILRRRAVHQLFAGVRCGDVEQFHCILGGRVFVVIGEDEQLGQLPRPVKELQSIMKSLSRKQYQ